MVLEDGNGTVMSGHEQPWYETTLRWGQTNLTEIDPQRYEHETWVRQWKRTAVQGVIVNAGGIIAYYPTEVAYHYRSRYLGDRDLFGEIAEQARSLGLRVVARMDCNRAHEELYEAHPDWFAVDAQGQPHRAGERYISCIFGPYYEEHIPAILREVAERYGPDGFADNSWSGLSRSEICHCINCRTSFQGAVGESLPLEEDWSSPVYRAWIRWNYDRRTRIWELFNEVTRSAGGADCIWVGMNSGRVRDASERFRDIEQLVKRTPLVFLDHQTRSEAEGFQENAYAGGLVNGLLGWDGVVTESMAMYNYADPAFRVASKPEPDARMWALSGFAGGIHPWWHHIGSTHRDRRQYETAPPIWTWHERAQPALVDRRPVANVGIVWSQRNVDYYGRDDAEHRVELPRRGMRDALIQARIPHVPVAAGDLATALDELDVLVLPAVGVLSDEQCELIRGFVRRGGGVVATGETSRYDEHGDRRDELALAELFGIRSLGGHEGAVRFRPHSWERSPTHSYLDILDHDEDVRRHPVLAGLEGTQQLPFGGRLERVEVVDGRPLLGLIPAFPVFPPETSWHPEPTPDVPGAVVREDGGRVVYLPADLDRCYGRGYQPDHATVLANAVRWAARGRLPVEVRGPGIVDVHLYRARAADRYILHLVNLSSAGAWRAPMTQDLPIGPLRVRLPLAGARRTGGVPQVWSFVTDRAHEANLTEEGALEFTLDRVVDHDVVSIGPVPPAPPSTEPG